jgi:cytochrome b561
MLSAARFPITLVGPIHLPGIAPHNIDVYGVLRECHSVFAFLLFLTFTAHICAVLFHTLVLRDRLLDRMALWPTKPASPQRDETV